jgi:hypothetical protein
MISLTLRFQDDTFPNFAGQNAGKFLLDMLKENPHFALQAADEIEVKGSFGKFVEER